MNELDAYIKNLETLISQHEEIKKAQASDGLTQRPGTDGLKMMLEFSIKTARAFKQNTANQPTGRNAPIGKP